MFLTFVILTDQNSIFILKCDGKIKVLRGYCGDDDPNLYTGPQALFDNVDASEEKPMIGEAPEYRIT